MDKNPSVFVLERTTGTHQRRLPMKIHASPL
jgi:hypothetical protein